MESGPSGFMQYKRADSPVHHPLCSQHCSTCQQTGLCIISSSPRLQYLPAYQLMRHWLCPCRALLQPKLHLHSRCP